MDGAGIGQLPPLAFMSSSVFPEMAQWIPAIHCSWRWWRWRICRCGLYGEIEFWFAMIEITTIIVMIVIGLGVIFFRFGNGGSRLVLAISQSMAVSLRVAGKGSVLRCVLWWRLDQGVELIGITAGEVKNPQVTLRSAVGKVLWRILIFYVGAIFVIVTIFPWNEIGSNGSPFVPTFAKIGITAAAGIINFVVLTAALSGGSSGMTVADVCSTHGEKPRLMR
ncbi:hypothetical protein ACNKHT_25120 [Shigella flexneri]